jgi:predicted DNA repair protein MutK
LSALTPTLVGMVIGIVAGALVLAGIQLLSLMRGATA